MKWFIQAYFGAPGFWGTQWLSLAVSGIFTRDLSRYMAKNWLHSDQLNQLSSVQHPCWSIIIWDYTKSQPCFAGIFFRSFHQPCPLGFFFSPGGQLWLQFHGWPLLGSNLGSTVLNIYLRQAIVQACPKKIDEKHAARCWQRSDIWRDIDQTVILGIFTRRHSDFSRDISSLQVSAQLAVHFFVQTIQACAMLEVAPGLRWASGSHNGSSLLQKSQSPPVSNYSMDWFRGKFTGNSHIQW